MIPPVLWFTYKTNVLHTQNNMSWHDVQLRKNIQHTSNDMPNLHVNLLDDRDCIRWLHKVENMADVRGLTRAFANERDGSFRGDLCRGAVLYLKGGLYLDVDVRTVGVNVYSYLMSPNITFCTAISGTSGYLFNAIMAATPFHPILLNYLKGMTKWYKGRRQGLRWVGDALVSAIDETKKSTNASFVSSWKFLLENRLTRDTGSVRMQKGVGCCCNYVVREPDLDAVLFFSRHVGISSNCMSAKNDQSRTFKQARSQIKFE